MSEQNQLQALIEVLNQWQASMRREAPYENSPQVLGSPKRTFSTHVSVSLISSHRLLALTRQHSAHRLRIRHHLLPRGAVPPGQVAGQRNRRVHSQPIQHSIVPGGELGRPNEATYFVGEVSAQGEYSLSGTCLQLDL